MSTHQLSPELYAHIISLLAPPVGSPIHWSQRSALLQLTLVSKAFSAAATSYLYANCLQGTFDLICRACFVVRSHSERLGPLVRFIYVMRSSEDKRTPELHFEIFQDALGKMPNLETLHFCSHVDSPETWIFTPKTPFPFQLNSFRFAMHWDKRINTFLDTQRNIRRLCHIQWNSRSSENGLIPPLRTDSLPHLAVFEGSIYAAMNFVDARYEDYEMDVLPDARPLECVSLDCGPDGPVIYTTDYRDHELLWWFKHSSATLRSFKVSGLTAEYTAYILQLLTEVCPRAVHLGVFPVLPLQRKDFLVALTRFSQLRTIELDVTELPLPSLSRIPYGLDRQQVAHWHGEERRRRFSPALRMLASELRVYCRTLDRVIFWNKLPTFECDEKYTMQCLSADVDSSEGRDSWKLEGYLDWSMRVDFEFEGKKKTDMTWCIA